LIQHAVIREYRLELERAEQPGYVSRYDEEYVEYIPHSVSTPSIIPRPHMLDKPNEAGTPNEAGKQTEASNQTEGGTAGQILPPENPFGDGIF
jgi:hypothetical protein